MARNIIRVGPFNLVARTFAKTEEGCSLYSQKYKELRTMGLQERMQFLGILRTGSAMREICAGGTPVGSYAHKLRALEEALSLCSRICYQSRASGRAYRGRSNHKHSTGS